MPTYQYKCDDCEIEFEETLRIADRKTPVGKLCGTCGKGKIQQVPQSPSMMYTMRDGFRRHTSDGFKDRMKEIHRSTPGSQLGDYT
ncbi:MAG: zinc ribbon domain-containing protein [Candidatus Pacebacteria bacterium]|nr:zinc ribbon domain-containing protein [Candidatus Paceibacterota bacterium]